MAALHNNRNLLDQLRQGLDLQAVEMAASRGDITRRQAKNVAKFIQTAKDIRENPVYAIVDQAGHYVGEVSAKNGGRSWIGCRYERTDPLPASEFGDFEDAKLFVCSTEPGDLNTMKEYKPRILFC